jgi:hypothetical protein
MEKGALFMQMGTFMKAFGTMTRLTEKEYIFIGMAPPTKANGSKINNTVME